MTNNEWVRTQAKISLNRLWPGLKQEFAAEIESAPQACRPIDGVFMV